MKVLGVADSDSYVKWGAAMLGRMPESWTTSLSVIRTPALPTDRQLASALSGTEFAAAGVPVVDLADLAAVIAREQPDVVLLSLRGPVVRVIVRAIVATGLRRPVIVSGLPGISIPETLNALYYRSQVDYFVLHSKREIRQFSALRNSLRIGQDFGLATLPFLPARRTVASTGTDIVFAAQAKVPRSEDDRRLLVGWLVEAARRHPEHRVVFKLRGVAGEPQTHSERWPFDVLLGEVENVPDNVVITTGPMSDALERASGLVTVSSTAALEAVATGVPVIALDDFGVSGTLINVVFEGSGMLAASSALLAADFRHPEEEWLDDNYFHAPSDETWIDGIVAAVARRDAGELELRPQFRGSFGGNLRRIWDRKRALGDYDRSLSGSIALAVGVPLRGLVRKYRAVRARAARRRDAADASPAEPAVR